MAGTDSQAPPPKLKAAGFWIRAAAHGIDLAILMAILLPLMFAFVFWAVVNQREVALPPWADLVFYALMVPVIVLLWWTMQATPGKKLCGLVVVDAHTGGRAAVGKLTIRSLAYLISCLPVIPLPMDTWMSMMPSSTIMPIEMKWMPFPLFLGFFWVFFSRRNYAWHDMVSGAIVVRKSALEAEAASAGDESTSPAESS